MDLAPYIRDLILSNECVILRGVGGFETSYRHAELDKNKKLIVPPSKHIRFRNEWTKDNGVLEEHLAEVLDISHDKASEYIDRFVQDLFAVLKEKGNAILEGLGEFSLDDKAKLQFRELEYSNYLADSFGLDVLDLDTENESREQPAARPLTPVVQHKRKMTLWYIIISVLMLMISVTLIILLSEGGNTKLFPIGKKAGSDEVIVFGTSTPPETDSTTQSIEKTLDSNTSPKTALSIQSAPPKSSISGTVSDTQNPEKMYYLVAGSFRTNRNAEVMKEQLIREGFEADIIAMGVNVRVIVGKYTDRKQAIAELRRMRQQLDQSVWLLED